MLLFISFHCGTDGDRFCGWSVSGLDNLLDRDTELACKDLSDMLSTTFPLTKSHCDPDNAFKIIDRVVTSMNFFNDLFFSNIFTTTNDFHTLLYSKYINGQERLERYERLER